MDMSIARDGVACGLDYKNMEIVVVGGKDVNSVHLDSTEIFSIKHGTW